MKRKTICGKGMGCAHSRLDKKIDKDQKINDLSDINKDPHA